ncbi:unnamed protein product [Euphydryas editha]|uniref:Uncharacterized protein n=1 Tax=Euphydryas editha TaxID=104508 RepID=A0AAU9UQE2_EUPED|nr:unnamed protein product [Euphydryas editha]
MSEMVALGPPRAAGRVREGSLFSAGGGRPRTTLRRAGSFRTWSGGVLTGLHNATLGSPSSTLRGGHAGTCLPANT